MPCLLALLIVAFPRIAIVLLYLFTTFHRRVPHGVVAAVGFYLLPITLIAYTFLINMHQPQDATFLVVLFVCRHSRSRFARRRP